MKKLTRREFLRASTATVAGAALSACARATPTPGATQVSPTTPPTEAPEEGPFLEGLKLSIAHSEHPAHPVQKDAPAHKEIERLTGVELDIIPVPGDDWPAKLSLWLSTDQVPDLIKVDRNAIRDYAREGVLYPLDELIDEHAPHLKQYVEDNPLVFAKMRFDGTLYHIPGVKYNFTVNAPMPLIRMDIIEELGLEEPDNFDELYEVWQELGKAYPDAHVITTRLGGDHMLQRHSYAMGTGLGMYYEKAVDGGKWLYGAIHEEFKPLLDLFARAYAEGLLDPDFPTITQDEWHEKQSSGKGLYTWMNASFPTRWNSALQEIDPDAYWMAMHIPEGPRGRRSWHYPFFWGGYAIGANTEDPVGVIKWLDWTATPLGLDVTNWGVEGLNYEYKEGKSRPETVEEYTPQGLGEALPPEDKVIPEGVYEEYAEKRDSYRAWQTDAGTGMLDLVIFKDCVVHHLWDVPGGHSKEVWDTIASEIEKGIIVPLESVFLEPPLAAEEVERRKEIIADVETILMPAYDKVILGDMSLAEYDEAVEQAKEAGAEELEDIYNEAWARAAG